MTTEPAPSTAARTASTRTSVGSRPRWSASPAQTPPSILSSVRRTRRRGTLADEAYCWSAFGLAGGGVGWAVGWLGGWSACWLVGSVLTVSPRGSLGARGSLG